MMIDVNKKKLKKSLSRLLVVVLLIAVACGYQVIKPGSTFITGEDDATQTAASADESTNWGLSFQQDGQAPVGNATSEELAKHNACYVADESKKTIYLTFDAGFENGYTSDILDVLKKEKVPAAFFLVGTYMDANRDLVKRMAEEGHIVANHTMNHPDMSAIADEAAFKSELEQVEDLYKEITGEEMKKYYRPPQGKFSLSNLELANKLGYKTVFWSLAYVDWYVDQQPTREEALQKLLPRTHNGAIILLHSTSKTNAQILSELITKWKEEGYQFNSLEKLGK